MKQLLYAQKAVWKYNLKIQSGSTVNIIVMIETINIKLTPNYGIIIFWKCGEQKCA